MNRRDVVKTLAAISMLPFSKLAWAAGPKFGCPPDTGNDTFVHFIFHGLFFMQFANGGIEIAAPNLSKATPTHELFGGQLGHLIPITSKTLDLTSLVKPGSRTDFSKLPSLPQFSMQETGVSTDFRKSRTTITLRQPAEIFPLRPGRLSDFELVFDKGPVQTSLLRACSQGGNKDLAVAVCLRYESAGLGSGIPGAGPLTYHFYCESTAGGHSNQEMNSVYSDTNLRDMVKNFELTLKDDVQPTQLYIPINDACSSGISDEDQLSLHEVTGLQSLYQQEVELLQAAKAHSGSSTHPQAKSAPKKQEHGASHALDKNMFNKNMFNVKVADCIPYALEP